MFTQHVNIILPVYVSPDIMVSKTWFMLSVCKPFGVLFGKITNL